MFTLVKVNNILIKSHDRSPNCDSEQKIIGKVRRYPHIDLNHNSQHENNKQSSQLD